MLSRSFQQNPVSLKEVARQRQREESQTQLLPWLSQLYIFRHSHTLVVIKTTLICTIPQSYKKIGHWGLSNSHPFNFKILFLFSPSNTRISHREEKKALAEEVDLHFAWRWIYILNPFLCFMLPCSTVTDPENSLLPVALKAAIPSFSTEFTLFNMSQTRRGFLCFKGELQS